MRIEPVSLDETPASPCVGVCRMDAAGLCIGCRRTLAEIAPPHVPDDRNAAVVYQRAFRLLQRPVGDRSGELLTEYISVDPVLSLDQHQSLNGYAYADNSPVTFSDPTGLKVFGVRASVRRL